MIFIHIVAQNCGDIHVENSFNLNGSVQFSQNCQNQNSKCVQFRYRDLPEQYKNVFQLVDPNDSKQYNLCGYYTSEQNCQHYCQQKCKQINTLSQPMKFNLSMSARHNDVIYTQEYTNETAVANYSHVCVNFGFLRQNSTKLVIVVCCCSVLFVALLYVSGCISSSIKQKKYKKSWDDVYYQEIDQLSA
ncbi:Hypothetical_protein [Hexamita inflata]|uniref:Hypothetical_protein n=1 Tax=Hexamita inflata TaxID=28002 RepID=A0AA86TZ72_9EUKA|nr:Hypothetical protein HINF_LOCUS21646 [Hexamita inflata]